MARSAHAYVRGSTKHFYDWLSDTHGRTLPEGPAIWICGDCHVGNLGPVAGSKESVEIELRDLDQTVIGNPAHDVIRLGLSMAMVARGSDLPGVTTAFMLEEIMRGYEAILERRADGKDLRQGRPAQPVRLILKDAVRRSWRHLLDERFGDTKPEIPIGRRFWPLTKTERRALEKLFKSPAVHQLVTALRCRSDVAEVELIDAAYWVKGCSSLGAWRAAALVKVGEGKETIENGGVCLIDIKEALAPLAPRTTSAGMPQHQGERVVTGARSLAPLLGDRMLAETVLDRQVFIRELLPQDLKIEITRIEADEAREVARFLAGVLGVAHASQLGAEDCRSWLTELRSRYSKAIDTPTWLWSSVVELIGIHEAAYLEHCRKHALGR
jgi:uncharacterized protein (DUF2252 family)